MFDVVHEPGERHRSLSELSPRQTHRLSGRFTEATNRRGGRVVGAVQRVDLFLLRRGSVDGVVTELDERCTGSGSDQRALRPDNRERRRRPRPGCS